MQQQGFTQRVAVIGSGIVGVCCAAYLQRSGWKVDVFDPNGISHGCSKGNAGHLATEQVFPMAGPGLLTQLPRLLLSPSSPLRLSPLTNPPLLPWLSRFAANMRSAVQHQNSQALQQLNQRAQAALLTLLTDAQCASLIRTQGSWMVFEQNGQRDVDGQIKRFNQAGVSAEGASGVQVRKAEPALSDTIRHGIFFADTGHVTDPQLLGLKLFAHCQRQGARLLLEKVSRVIPRHDHALICTPNKSRRYSHVVIAAGVTSRELLAALGVCVPLIAEYGFHAMTPAVPGLHCPVTSAERHCIMTPMNNGLRVAGFADFSAAPSALQNQQRRAATLLGHARALIDPVHHLPVQPSHHWHGGRPSLPDSLPIIDRLPDHPHILVATGHGHLGLTQAGITGALISQLINQQPTTIDLTPFMLSRFIRNTASDKAYIPSALPHYSVR
ncbi:FAD-binding oxidoreductase [Aestuariibacter halophilus]|uniref:FAD-binding oxidoreductase n=1 Tax=Fluctibacter halophilus TaxID=226011 RepID=A0ABS8G361_9ALTE|nr:FAD-binding oxidoreductase [Aestuariibacter halophilus]MCC2615014.1 FAD-binding oxidoreductase [Aestuariibacter halophilus]